LCATATRGFIIYSVLGNATPGLQQMTIETLNSPSVVVSGTTNPGYVAFINQRKVSPGSSSPFVVFVDPTGKPKPAVASLGYRRDFKDVQGHKVLWLPPQK
jgi:hypothetical protein